MAGRLNKEEETLKINALWMAYKQYKDDGIDTPSYDMVTEKANEYEDIRKCNKPIGRKTLAQSKNKYLIELRKVMQSTKKKVAELKAISPTELSIKIEQLHSSLEANAILARKIEDLEIRLQRRDEILKNKEIRITEFAEEIERLRAELRHLKV